MRRFAKTTRASDPRGGRGRRVSSGAAALVLVVAACASFPEATEEAEWPTPARGMVVSEHPLASGAGLEILESGGNAADAAVATALALAVVYPQAGNLGGGGFAIWVPHGRDADLRALDFRETAPAALSAAAFLDEEGRFVPERSLASGLAVGVPGSPSGLWMLHAELGRLPLSQVARPAIELARDGFEADAWLARDLDGRRTRTRLRRGGMAGAVFYPDGEPVREGQRIVQGELAATLEQWVKDGPAGFYSGPVAEAIVEEVKSDGGVMSLADLTGYQAQWREPLRGWFRGHEIVTMPPPSSGGLVLLQVLNILDGFPLDDERERTLGELAAVLERDLDPEEPGLSGRAVHWWIEAMRRAFADRAQHMGDPDFTDVPAEELLSTSWIAERRISIGELADPDVGPMPRFQRENGDTTHLSVLDEEGNAVSLTTTLNTGFGSGLMVRGYGFLLNNEIDDFSIQVGTPNTYGLIGSEANAVAPLKRPLSSMTPAVVRDGGQSVRMILGSPGGPRIISAVIQVILRTEVYGQGLAAAVAAPRLHQQWVPRETRFEDGWDPLLISDLRNRNHGIDDRGGRFGSVQAIRLEVGGEPVGVSDPRRGGAVATQGRGVGQAARPVEEPR